MNTIRARIGLVALSTAPMACADAEVGRDERPAGWVHIESTCRFAFDAPPGTQAIPTQGLVDSCVAQFESEHCTFTGDYGAFSDPLDGSADQPEYAVDTLQVDGQQARLVRFRAAEPSPEGAYFAGIHVPEVGGSPGLSVTLSAWCVSAQAQTDAVTALRTITILPDDH